MLVIILLSSCFTPQHYLCESASSHSHPSNQLAAPPVSTFKNDRVYRYIGNPNSDQDFNSIPVVNNDVPDFQVQQDEPSNETNGEKVTNQEDEQRRISVDEEEESVADRTGIPDRIFIQINHQTSDVKDFLEKYVITDSSSTSDDQDASIGRNLSHRSASSLAGNQNVIRGSTTDENDYSDDNDNDSNAREGSDDHDDRDVHVESLFRGYATSSGSSPPDPDLSSSSSSSSSSPSVQQQSTTTTTTTITSRSRTNVKKIPRITSPAGCEVEMRTVEIKDPLKENELYYPWCVRVPRCSGCCPSNRLKCVPTNTSIIEVNVSTCQQQE